MAARARGVFFDLGHGQGSFTWTVAEAAARAGCYQPGATPSFQTVALADIGCHSLEIYILILLPLLSLSVKMIVLPTASAELIAIQSHTQALPRRTAKCLQPSLRGCGVRRTCST